MSRSLTIQEIECLGYYDFMGYMGVPFFNIGGAASMDRLAELCHVTGNAEVLDVGCGTGGNACYLANKYGCKVVGVDMAEHMVEEARGRADELGLTERVSFKVGDAYGLEFPDDSFDAVVTVFVSQFLDPARAFRVPTGPQTERVPGHQRDVQGRRRAPGGLGSSQSW